MSDVEVVPRWTLGDRLRKARLYADLKQSDLAADLGVSSQAIGRWENGAPIKLAFVKVWAARCGVPVEWLWDGTLPSDEDRAATGWLTGGSSFAAA